MLATIDDGYDAVAGGELGEMFLEGCTLAGAEVVVWREGAPDCFCEACLLCWRNSKGKREEQVLGWPANTKRMALGVGGCASDTFCESVGWSRRRRGADGWIQHTQSRANAFNTEFCTMEAFGGGVAWETERSGGWMISAWSRPPSRLVVVDSFCSYTDQVSKAIDESQSTTVQLETFASQSRMHV
jgi:hypothetical protein